MPFFPPNGGGGTGGIDELTSDVTASGTGSVAATVVNVDTPVIGDKVEGAGGITISARTPQPPSGASLWFKFDELPGADTDPVSSFVDSSGFNVVASQATSGHRPTVADAAIGGLRALKCSKVSGNNQVSFLSGSLNISSGTGATVFFVAKTGTTTNLNGTPLALRGTGIEWLFSLGSDATSGVGQVGTNGSVLLGGVTGGIQTSHAYYARYAYDKADWTTDGLNTGTYADTSYPTGLDTFYVGTSIFTNTQFEGWIGEIIVYNRQLTAQELADVKSYLTHKWGLDISIQATKLAVGYPVELTQPLFAQRYAHPLGDDDNDGLSWQTAKETWLGAFDSGASLPSSTVLEIYYQDLTYIGGEVTSQGIWMNAIGGVPAAGWRQWRPLRTYGVGGTSTGIGFGQAQARLLVGQPGDPQGFSTAKPFIWMYDMEVDTSFYNVKPYESGQWRLGVKYDGSRDGLVSNMFLNDCSGASPAFTTGNYGTVFDCGWMNVCWFNRCLAFGASAYQTPVITNTDNVVASTRTWTIANGAFTDDHVGGWLKVEGAIAPYTGNNGVHYIESVTNGTNGTTVVTTADSSLLLVDETFDGGNVTISVSYGPSILDSDDMAGFLFKPNAPIAGEPGTLGRVTFNGVFPVNCGIKQYVGAQGFDITINDFLSEHGPMPHPIQITQLPTTSVPLTLSSCRVVQTNIADAEKLDNYDIWIHPDLHDSLPANTVVVGNIAGQIYGPAVYIGNNDHPSSSLPTTPLAVKQYGVMGGGRLSGSIDSGRRLGAPGSALPSSDTNTGVTNLASHNPSVTGPWTAAGGATLTRNTLDVFGLNNAADLTGTGSLTFVASTEAYKLGEYVLAGIWSRGIPSVSLYPTTGTLGVGNMDLGRAWVGNQQWDWYSNVAQYTHADATDTMTLKATSNADAVIGYCYPVLLHLKNTAGHTWTFEEACELKAHLATWNPNLAQGHVGTLRGQCFVADGGFGLPDALFRTVGVGTGQLTLGSVHGYVPIYDKDGTTILCWVLGTNATVNP